MRELRTYGKVVSVEVEICDICKYSINQENRGNWITVKYDGLVNWEIVTGDDATEIGLTTDEASRDPFNEYLVLHFEDGSEATFRNSFVDMFRV